MADTSFLLGSQPVQAPDILGMAGKGLTLADLMQKNQMNDLALRTQQANINSVSDPRYLSAMGLNGTPGAPGYGQPSGPDLAGLIQQFPEAGPTLLKQTFDMQKQQADIAELRAKALDATAAALEKNLKPVQGAAAVASTDPSVQNVGAYANALYRAGLRIDSLGPLPDSGDATAYRKYFDNVQQALNTPEGRLAAARQLAELPGVVAKNLADTRKANVEADLAPGAQQIKQQEANTGSFNAATSRATAMQAKPYAPPGQPNLQYVDQPDMSGNITRKPMTAIGGGALSSGSGNDINSPAAQSWIQSNNTNQAGTISGGPGVRAPVAMPAMPTDGMTRMNTPAFNPAVAATQMQPPVPTLGLTQGEIKLNEGAASKVADMVDQLPAINSAINRFASLKSQVENDKLMTGPVFGQEGFQHIAGIISQLPGASKELREYVANTQIANATALSGVFNIMGEGKGTMPRSTAAMQMLVEAKPGTTQYREAMLHLTNELIADLVDRAGLIGNFASEVKKPGGFPGAQNFPPNSSPAAASRFADKPDPAAYNGRRITGPDGTFQSDGINWNLVGAPKG